ncbi:MAG: response regulator [Dehalococcoidia bacterium]|jgi:DNA-binding NarL/FixJ family response regulator
MKVILADRSGLIKQRLIALLGDRQKIQVVGQPMNSAEVISDVWKFQPDALVIDPLITDGAIIEVLTTIKKNHPGIFVIVATGNTDTVLGKKCLAAGADLLLNKSSEFNRIIEALKERHRTRGERK